MTFEEWAKIHAKEYANEIINGNYSNAVLNSVAEKIAKLQYTDGNSFSDAHIKELLEQIFDVLKLLNKTANFGQRQAFNDSMICEATSTEFINTIKVIIDGKKK